MAEQIMGTDCATVIGSDVVISGEVKVEKGLRVDGKIEGQIKTAGKVYLGKTGRIEGEIEAGLLVAEGQIEGEISAERLQVEATAKVHGTVRALKFEVSEGAVFVGQVQVGPEARKAARLEMPEAVVRRMSASVEIPVAEPIGAGNGNGKHKVAS
ncbi:MAG: polymer-forming cytoskeletal protein [Planctomycetota bacterium]|nr:polymer-forming cytoskeletal protein [Planctomycetota bacterium]